MMMKYIIRLNAATSKEKKVYTIVPIRYTNQNRYGIRNHSQNGIMSSSGQCIE